mmetsp:Transcript_14173/g.20781  ORF Transcript_14173/g.20781 Transcript_14173/m.20781 type:complete len:233 (-) Transcript_14173:546-1244(-)
MNRYPNISEMKESSKVILDSRRFCHKPTGVKHQRLFITIIITIVMCSSRPSVVESFSSQPFLGRNDQPHLDQQPYVNRQLFYSHLDRNSYRNQRTNLSRINSATIDPPRAYGGDSSDMSSFQKKMLERMTGKKLTTTRRSKRIRTVKLPPNVQTVRTLEEYKKVVAGEKDRLVVVRFFATWCKVSYYYQNAISQLVSTNALHWALLYCLVSPFRHIFDSSNFSTDSSFRESG